MTLYENTITRGSSLDKGDNIQEAYELMLEKVGTEKTKEIRQVLKKELGLTNRDVSVVYSRGSAINVKLKTVKSLPYKNKIKEVAQKHENIRRDYVTHDILRGGNTFVFVEVDWKFRDKLVKKIESEITKQITDDFLNDIGTNVIKVFKKYDVVKEKGSKTNAFYVPDPKNHTVGQTNMNTNQAANRVLSLMLDYEDMKNLKKLG